jgi:diacylglycerol kinase (ATP)
LVLQGRGLLPLSFLKSKSMKQNFFSVNTWAMRFNYAAQGMIIFFRTEHTAWVYLISTIAVAAISIWKGVTKNEAIALVFVIGFVWVSELFNTVIEKLADMISVKFDVQIKIIKDLAAAAVLLSAIAALITGMLIFIPKF